MEVKYSSYTEAQKRATKKYRQSNKDKVNEQNKKYYSNKKDGDEKFLLMKNLKSKLTYQVRKINKLVIDGKITQFEYDDKYTNLLHKYNSDLADLHPIDELIPPTPPSPTDEATESEYSSPESSSSESSSSESSSSESSLYTSTDESSSDESKTSIDSNESNKPYIEESECLETRIPILKKPTMKPKKTRAKKVVEPSETDSTTIKKRTRNKKIKQDLNPPIIMEFEQNSINVRFDQPI